MNNKPNLENISFKIDTIISTKVLNCTENMSPKNWTVFATVFDIIVIEFEMLMEMDNMFEEINIINKPNLNDIRYSLQKRFSSEFDDKATLDICGSDHFGFILFEPLRTIFAPFNEVGHIVNEFGRHKK